MVIQNYSLLNLYKLFVFVILISGNIGFSQSVELKKLDVYFNTLENNEKFMGSVAIYKEDTIIYNRQVGFLNVNKGIGANSTTKYRIGSISKTFTAVLIFKAIEEGKINLNETLNNYFPGIKNASKITISNLLNHRSGIHSFTDNRKIYLSYHTQPKSEKEMVNIISAYDSDFEPDSGAAYSNSNYLLLSYILERIYMKKFGQILQDKLCTPLKLDHTYYRAGLSNESNESDSYVYSKKQWKIEPQTHGEIGLGAGTIISNPTDLIRFSDALFNGELISEEHLKKMKTIRDHFGMGLFLTRYFDKVSYGHNGGIDGFVSMFRYFPESKMAFAVTANGLNYNFNAIETVIAKALFDKHFDIPIFSSYKPSSKELDLYLGEYSSNSFPVKITIVKSKKNLLLKVVGQKSMQLEAYEKNKFKFDPAAISIEFFPEKDEMSIKQHGTTHILKRES